MQTTLDMNIAAMICDSAQMAASCQGGDRNKAASGSDGEGRQQRFADVLPVAQAALETPSEEEAEVQDTAEEEPADVLTDEDLPADPGVRSQGETEVVNPEAVGWLFAGILQSEPVEVVVERQTDVLSVEPEPASAEEQMSAPEAGVILAGAQSQSQATVTTSLVDVPLDDDVAADSTVSAETQTASSVAVAGNPVPSAIQLGQETSLPVSTGVEQAPSAWQLTQESAAADASQVVRAETPEVQADAADERMQGELVPETADPVLQAEEADVSDSVKSTTSDSQPTVVAETTQQTPDESRRAATQTSARSEKSVYQQMLSEDSQSNDASGRSETVSTESVQSADESVSASSVKDVVATPLQQSVFSEGETAVFSQRSVTQTESQVSTDTSAVRSSAQSIGEQILDSVQAAAVRGDKQVLVRLNPPELGNILVRFQEQGDFVTGTLEVGNGETRREIEQALPQVARALQEAGVQIRRLEVVASDQSDGDLSREHLAQDGWSQRQEADQSREQSYASPQTRWSQGQGGLGAAQGAASETQTTTAQGRIDLLL